MKNRTGNITDILVVDDNPNNLRLICEMLKKRRYTVRPALSGPLAIEAAANRAPDVILMDVNMPGMDGYDACRELKRREELRDIPVIFASALGETVDKVRAFEAGGIDYVTKPIQIEEVEARIESHMTIRRLRLELQERYDDLRRSESLREQLTHMIVHDLRNPLAVILGGLEFAVTNSPTKFDAATAEVLDLANTQAGTLNRMISELLDIGRMEDGKMRLSQAGAEVSTILEKARGSVALKGQLLSVDLSAAPRSLCCDSELVRRVLTNLIGNAVKFTPSGCAIEVAAKSVSDGTRFEVRDSGAGIAPEFHEKIFEKFTQVEGTTRADVPSTGLGLTFCRLAIEAHGGRIGVESAPGEGSLFWFTLPETPPLSLAA
ncbi:MAG: two-component system sensor histidine kinase/response regulator [Verrucomicrobiales bacterium]|jgi:two-component system sensor histidine kinase/response regulator